MQNISKEKLQSLFECLMTGVLYHTVPPTNQCMLCGLNWEITNILLAIVFYSRLGGRKRNHCKQKKHIQGVKFRLLSSDRKSTRFFHLKSPKFARAFTFSHDSIKCITQIHCLTFSLPFIAHSQRCNSLPPQKKQQTNNLQSGTSCPCLTFMLSNNFLDKPNKNVVGDQSKTLFIARLSKDTTQGMKTEYTYILTVKLTLQSMLMVHLGF